MRAKKPQQTDTPTDERKHLLKRNEAVTSPITRIDPKITSEIKKNMGGRKKKFTPTRMKNQINKYFEFCETEDRVPSIKGLMIYLKMYRDQFYQYLSYPEFKDIMEHARLIIREWCENDVYRTKGQAAAKIAYMKNVHDWTEKVESESTVRQIVSPEEARARIEMLAPKLLEILKQGNVLNQLVYQEGVQEAEETILSNPPIPNLGFVEENNPRRL